MQKIIAALQIIPQTVEDMLRNEVARLNAQIFSLELNQMAEENRQRIFLKGKDAGKMETMKIYEDKIEKLKFERRSILQKIGLKHYA